MAYGIWPEKRFYITKANSIKLGGETIEVKPLTLENSLRLILLLAPYIVAVEHRWSEIKAALESTNGTRPQLLQTVFMQLYNELAFAPGVVVQALSILIDRNIEWVAINVRAEDLIRAWPTLDRVNAFASLWMAVRELGLVARYTESP